MDNEQAFPVIRQTVLDTTDPRRLAEFYRQLFGLRYVPGDEPPGPDQPDPAGQDWLILTSPAGGVTLAFQKVGELPGATWPDGPVPQQLHLDATVPTMADLDVQHERALTLGARLLQDRSDDPAEALRVYADPPGIRFASSPLLTRPYPPAETPAAPRVKTAELAGQVNYGRPHPRGRPGRDRARGSQPCWQRHRPHRAVIMGDSDLVKQAFRRPVISGNHANSGRPLHSL
jgi:hypothetical protein